MQTTKAKQGQSFFDVVIENTGSIFNTFDIASLNDKSVTESLQTDENILIVGATKKRIVQLFSNGHYPATSSFVKEFNFNYEYSLPLTFPII